MMSPFSFFNEPFRCVHSPIPGRSAPFNHAWLIVAYCFTALACILHPAFLLFFLAPLFAFHRFRYYLARFSPIFQTRASLLCSAFRNLRTRKSKVSRNSHSHPVTAADRDAASQTIDDFIILNGYSPYVLQPSRADVKRGYAHSLTHHWAKDAHSPERADALSPNHIVKMVNVDYYIDWAEYAHLEVPFLLYTFTPTDVAGCHNEYTWQTETDGTVTTFVNGNTANPYNHQLWNYDTDFVTFSYPTYSVTYSVERVRHAEQFSFVLLTPVSRGPPTDTTLRRLQLVSTVETMSGPQTIASLRVQGPGEPYLSTSLAGHASSVRFPTPLVDHLRPRHSAKGLTIFDLNTIVPPYYPERADGNRAATMAFLTLPVAACPTAVSSNTIVADPAVSFVKVPAKNESAQEIKCAARILTPPVLSHSLGPARALANDQWCVAGRITAVANDKPMPPEYVPYVAEFIDRAAAPLVPKTQEEVYIAQKRPTQRMGNLRAALNYGFALAKTVIRAFQKAEAYPEAKDPRNISTLPSEHCLRYSRYTLAVADHLKTTAWYAFGLHPDDLGQRVYSLAHRSDRLTSTDFSRFDGTHSRALYEFELAYYSRCFPDDVAELRSLQKQMTDSPAANASWCQIQHRRQPPLWRC